MRTSGGRDAPFFIGVGAGKGNIRDNNNNRAASTTTTGGGHSPQIIPKLGVSQPMIHFLYIFFFIL